MQAVEPVRHSHAWPEAPSNVTLTPEEVHVVAFSLDLAAPRVHALTALLSPEELSRAQGFVQDKHRRRFIVGRARVRAVLGRYLARDPARLTFGSGTHGKPLLQPETCGLPVRFNASRSHELGMIAVQLDHDVGIDVEHVRPFPEALRVARRFFAPSEYRALTAVPPEARGAEFFRYWTRKEAVVKSLGLGLSHPLDTVRFEPQPGTSVERVVGTGPVGPGPRWSVPVPPPSPGYIAALVIGGPPRLARFWRWSDRGGRTPRA